MANIVIKEGAENEKCTVRKSTKLMDKAQQRPGAHVTSNFKNRGQGVIVGSRDYPNDEGYVLLVCQMVDGAGNKMKDKVVYTSHSMHLFPCEIKESLINHDWL